MQMGEESTIRGYIDNYGTDEITQGSLYFHQVLKTDTDEKMIVNIDSILLRYMPEILTTKEKHTLTESEYRMYRFNPKKLSFDLYGTTELWSLILDINELKSATDFDTKTVWLLPGYIVDRIERALNLEVETRKYNAEQVSADLLR